VHHLATREELVARVEAVMGMVASDGLRVRVSAEYALTDAARAYADLEGRKTTGKLVFAIRR
jgi:NADPH2:quinone reductase